jgi:hypothetical protein
MTRSTKLPDEIQDARWALADSCNEMKKLTRGAAMGTMDTALSVGTCRGGGRPSWPPNLLRG